MADPAAETESYDDLLARVKALEEDLSAAEEEIEDLEGEVEKQESYIGNLEDQLDAEASSNTKQESALFAILLDAKRAAKNEGASEAAELIDRALPVEMRYAS